MKFNLSSTLPAKKGNCIHQNVSNINKITISYFISYIILIICSFIVKYSSYSSLFLLVIVKGFLIHSHNKKNEKERMEYRSISMRFVVGKQPFVNTEDIPDIQEFLLTGNYTQDLVELK